MAIYNTTLFLTETKKLKIANKKIKRKRQKKILYISKRRVLNTQEVQEAQREVRNRVKSENQIVK